MNSVHEGHNCIDVFCPKCGNDNLHRLKNRDSLNHGKVNVFICDLCGEEFGGPLINGVPSNRKHGTFG